MYKGLGGAIGLGSTAQAATLVFGGCVPWAEHTGVMYEYRIPINMRVLVGEGSKSMHDCNWQLEIPLR